MGFPTKTTRLPNGMTNASEGQTFGSAGVLDPAWAHVDFDDLDAYHASDWTITKVGTGTVANVAGNGGLVALTNTTGATDAIYVQRPTANYAFPTTGRDTFFKISGKVSDVTNTVIYAGLIATSTTPLTANDGGWIVKATGQAGLVLKSVVGGVTKSVAFPTTDVLVNNTFFELGFHVSASGDVRGFFNPTTGAPTTTPNGQRCVLTAPGLTTANLAVSYGILNSNAAANVFTVDYYAAIQHR